MQDLQGEYDLIIAGTGLTESLIAGICSQKSKKLINFDRSQEYGGLLKTKGIHQFMKWANENAQIYTNNISKKLPPTVRNGEYSFDIFPIIVYSYDKIMDVLVNSKCFESLNTYLVEGLYFRTKDTFRLIPSSKSSIFSDKAIPLRQKRSLMKVIYYFLPVETYGHTMDISDVTAKVEEYKDKPFRDLLKALSFDDDLAGAFEYYIATASHPLLTSEAIPRIKSFFHSYGRYGPTPFVEFQYGASETPQIFARHSAVFGGTYILNHYPTKIERDETNDQLILHVDEIGEIRTKTFIANPENLESTGEKKLLAYREIVLLDRKMIDNDRSVAVIAPGVLKNTHPVYIYQFDHVLASCRNDEYLIHFSSMGEVHETVDILLDEIRQKYLQEKKEQKEKAKAEETQKADENQQQESNQKEESNQNENQQQEESNQNENQQQESKQNENQQEEVVDPDGFIILRVGFTLTEDIPKPMKGVIPVIAPSLDELTMGTNYFVEAAENIMKDIYPDIEFYPKPTEVEIMVDEEPEHQQQNEEATKEEQTQQKEQTEETPATPNAE